MKRFERQKKIETFFVRHTRVRLLGCSHAIATFHNIIIAFGHERRRATIGNRKNLLLSIRFGPAEHLLCVCGARVLIVVVIVMICFRHAKDTVVAAPVIY